MSKERSSHERRTAILVALSVTVLWSTSWVLIKVGLREIPAVPFAGLRYGLATLVLFPFFLRSGGPAALRRLPAIRWGELVLLGVIFYALTQGGQFVALAHLPAVTVNLRLGMTAPLVALLGIPFLAERPALLQWAGLGLAVAGAAVYIGPVAVPREEGLGLLIAGGGVLANAASSLLGRVVNRRGELSALTVTTVSMGVGAGILLAVGLSTKGLPRLGWGEWGIVAWLAFMNTALAFTLWNRALRALSAMESSLIQHGDGGRDPGPRSLLPRRAARPGGARWALYRRGRNRPRSTPSRTGGVRASLGALALAETHGAPSSFRLCIQGPSPPSRLAPAFGARGREGASCRVRSRVTRGHPGNRHVSPLLTLAFLLVFPQDGGPSPAPGGCERGTPAWVHRFGSTFIPIRSSPTGLSFRASTRAGRRLLGTGRLPSPIMPTPPIWSTCSDAFSPSFARRGRISLSLSFPVSS